MVLKAQLAAFLMAFGLSVASIAAPEKADLVITGAKIYTVDSDTPWAQAMAVRDDRIVYVGDDQGLAKWIGEKTVVRPLQGAMVLPGFQDAHVHPLEGASLETFMDCDLFEISSVEPNPENWAEELSLCEPQTDLHGWVLGGGHANTQLLTLDRTPIELLDEIFPDVPAAFMEKSSHSMWVNSLGLKKVGITRDTPNPQGGIIFRDQETGEPIGVLSDSAGDELMHAVLARTPALQEARYDALLRAQDYLVEHGITSANNARVYWNRGNLDPWLRAEREGALKTRMVLSLWAYPHLKDDEQLPFLEFSYKNDKNSLLRISQVKFYSDGVPDLNSAAVLDPYGYLIFPDANPMGLNYFTEERMARYITELERVGYSVIIHAIGDRGIRESLNAIEAARKANPGLIGKRHHYISHVGWVHEKDIPRFKQLGVIVDTQINFEPVDAEFIEEGEELDLWDALFSNTTSDLDALPELYQSGAKIVLSSDWDVSTIDPLYSIWAAFDVFGEVMSERQILEFAIKAYTLNAADAMGNSGMTGSITVGKFADFVILDQNLFEIDPDEIVDARVMETYMGGRKVYSRKSMLSARQP